MRIPLPTRVSRLYPVLALCFALSTAVLFYSWQSSDIELTNLSQIYAAHQAQLTNEVAQLTADKQGDQAKLQVQTQQIADATTKLQKLQAQVDSTTKDLATEKQQLTDAQSQLTANAAALQALRAHPPLFSFQNNSSLSDTDIAAKEAAVKSVVSSAYDYIQNLYGAPYALDSITITFVNNFDIAGADGEILITNGKNGISIDIHLKDFDPTSFQDTNALIHEMIHGFHGVAVIDSSALEEGMTVAMTDAVMARMIADGKLPQFSHLYVTISDQDYAKDNSSLTIPEDSTAFYANKQIATIYQVIGKAWLNLYAQDPGIFKKVNDYYYPLVQQGQKPDVTMILAAIKASISKVGSLSIDQYLAQNIAFNPK